MKLIIAISFLISTSTFAQTKAVKAIVPDHAQKTVKVKPTDAPCDSKEDVLKKLEEKKKAQEEAGKGFALQGAKDTGCSIK
ncbi:MAG: hypothetical protein K2Q18_08625 [Bdellovibrionales bacterium]|nr:hypothetical protein [Bdellovibrionales bacterium]